MAGLVGFAGRRDGPDAKAARIHDARHAPDRAALAGGVPSLEDHGRALAAPQIGLLDGLEAGLKLDEPRLIGRIAELLRQIEVGQAHRAISKDVTAADGS